MNARAAGGKSGLGALAAVLLSLMPCATAAQDADAGTGAPIAAALESHETHRAAPPVAHDGPHAPDAPPAPAIVSGAPDRPTASGMTRGSMSAASMQGGRAPADARDADYSDGIDPAPMNGMDMHGDAPVGMLLFNRLESFDGDTAHGRSWEIEGWYGNDTNRLRLRSEGAGQDGAPADANLELLAEHGVAAFWSMQAGMRLDSGTGPPRTWLAFGVQGLAPYWIALEATAYVGSSGRTAARLRAEYELPLTRRLILQPGIEADLQGRDDPARRIGSGLSELRSGVRLRYEIRREFAPYVGVEWVRRSGAGADDARLDGERVLDRRLLAGIRFWF